jgi:hypothetical protein
MRTKFLYVTLLLFVLLSGFSQPTKKTENVILITLDGFRWQELFAGAEKKLIGYTKQVKDTAELRRKFWAETPEERREKLLPFFWSTIARQGQLYGNRKAGSIVNITNPHKFSYPGYNEIFSGYGDPKINSNDYPDNPNLNIFDFLQSKENYKGRLAAFATWDAFPRIINSNRNGVPVFVNVQKDGDGVQCKEVKFGWWETACPAANNYVSNDTLTYHFAKEYMKRNHPRFVFIGFDETDEFAHEGKYDNYLHAAHMLDEFIKDLWVMIQNDPHYRDKTTLLITCDHGRGHKGKSMWRHHGRIVRDAHQIWLAAMGPDTKPLGEIKTKGKYFQNQIAQTIAHLFGLEYTLQPKAGKAIAEITGE